MSHIKTVMKGSHKYLVIRMSDFNILFVKMNRVFLQRFILICQTLKRLVVDTILCFLEKMDASFFSPDPGSLLCRI